MMTSAGVAGATGVRGPIGETRSIGLSILWFVLTIGIYGIYWVYKTQEEIKRHSGNGVGGVIGLVIYIVISPVTFFIVPSEVRYMYEDLDGRPSPVRGIYGLWILLPIFGPIIWFVQVQGALNSYWESKGASPA
jgi:amino acid transporter